MRCLLACLLVLPHPTASAANAAARNKELPAARPPQRPAAKKAYTILPARRADFARLKALAYKSLVAADKNGFTKSGDRFYFQLTNGRRTVLVSKPGTRYEADMAEISYEGKLTYLKKYVLHVMRWEGSATWLVDQHTGAVDELTDVPTPGPNTRNLAVLAQAYPNGGDTTNGIFIYPVQAGKLAKKIAIESDKWLPTEIRWINDSSLIVKCVSLANVEKADASGVAVYELPENSSKFFYLRVVIN